VVFLLVAQGRGDAALRRPRVGPERVQLRDNSHVGTPFTGIERSHQARSARSNDNNIVLKSHGE
jgi:hypothetical protein